MPAVDHDKMGAICLYMYSALFEIIYNMRKYYKLVQAYAYINKKRPALLPAQQQ